MSLRLFIIYLFVLSAGFFAVDTAYAQKGNKKTSDAQKVTAARNDSAARARQEALEQTRANQQRRFDSLKAVRQHSLDSTKAVRKRINDSLTALRKYKESKRYTDSVTKARQQKLNLIQAQRKAAFDVQKAARKRITDSMIASRKVRTDSIKAIQKHRSDSLAIIRKYRESKRFKDSVLVVKKQKLDNQKAHRKAFNDSLTIARKKITDSLANKRKAKTDSIASVRNKTMDSVKAVRKLKTDSLAKKKEKAEKDQKAKEKRKEEKMQLALELKIKKKHQAWSNEKMLKKRWSIPRQVIQNSFSRYNYYFNADKKMDEALDNMQRMRKDNYDSLIALFPFNPDRDSSVLSADMDSIIQKASLGIQIHDPRTKWGDDLYLLLGQAYYYKGNYVDASTAFRYVLSLRDKKKKKKDTDSRPSTKSSKAPSIAQAENKNLLDFLKHRSVHNEAILWLARTYTQMHQEGNAESVLDLLEADPNFPGSLQGRLALEKAYIYLGQHDDKGAIEQLTIVANDKELPQWVRIRAAFINGQLLQSRNDYKNAANNFRQVIGMNPVIDMDFYARKNMAYSLMLAGDNQEEALAVLKKVLNDGKYAPYYEQVYYVMGRLAANTGDYDGAIRYMDKGIASLKSTKKQKAISFATIGDIQYTRGYYMPAKNAYDSSVKYSSAAPDDSLVANAVRRSLVLGQVTTPAMLIHDQDSLLLLATLSKKERQQAVRKYIRLLASRKADSAFRAENAGLNSANQNTEVNEGNANVANWYYSNSALMQQGYNEFKRKWGTRTLKDNWRRSSVTDFSNNTTAKTESNDTSGVELDENGLPTEETLLSYIPDNEEMKADALKKIRAAYMSLANAYIKDLEDYPPAIKTLDTLDKRFPEHEYQAEVLYLRYLTALRQNQLPAAQVYSAQLQQKFGDSKWAGLVKPTEDGKGLAANDNSVVAFYDETYSLLGQHQYIQALARARDGQQRYREPRYQKRFRVVEAMALAGNSEFDKADTVITDFMLNNPTDSLFNWAQMVKDYIKKNRGSIAQLPQMPAAPIANPSPKPLSTDTTNNTNNSKVSADVSDELIDRVPPNNALIPENYVYKATEEHYVLFSFGIMESRAMGVKAGISDFNAFKFSSLGLTAEVEMLETQQGLIVVKRFPNANAAKVYSNSLRSTSQVFREYKEEEYRIVMISASNYLKLKKDKNIQPYLNFYKSNYK